MHQINWFVSLSLFSSKKKRQLHTMVMPLFGLITIGCFYIANIEMKVLKFCKKQNISDKIKLRDGEHINLLCNYLFIDDMAAGKLIILSFSPQMINCVISFF